MLDTIDLCIAHDILLTEAERCLEKGTFFVICTNYI